ncbi:MAG: MoxR family ATPase [Thermodesulfobacteriota bacterium]
MRDTDTDVFLNEEQVAVVHQAAAAVIDNVEKVIVGKREVITLILVALLCEGHVILEDVPGVGKTMLAKSVARSLACAFKRIQFTSDLLPADVTGLNYFNQKTSEFEFLPGPIMANVVLADEINRATPRTQACLLEAMEERQVTVDGVTRPLPRPFLVLATQNPVEQAGTFPLPEAQLDRFLLKVRQGYPSSEAENAIVLRFERQNPLDGLTPVLEGRRLLEMRGLCRRVFVEGSVREYLVNLVRATREHQSIRLGASPRATQGLYNAAQVLAAVRGRVYALPDDVKELAVPVLAHRLVINPEVRLRGKNKDSLVREIVDQTAVPAE